MMNKSNRLRRAALVLALLVLAAIVTGVAESATKTAVPKQMTGKWGRGGDNYGLIVVSPRGTVEINQTYHAKFWRVTAHRLSISGIPSCSGTGTYRWKIANTQVASHALKLQKIHDACKLRVGLFGGIWLRVRT